MSEETSSLDQMTDTQSALNFTEPSLNEAVLDLSWFSASSTSTHNILNNQLVSETINVLHNDMQLALPQAHQQMMIDVQSSSESNQVHMIILLENLIKKTSALSVPAESSGIVVAYSASNAMNIDVKTSEPLQITNAPYGNFQEASPERGLLRAFSAASVQPLETNERPSKDLQHLPTLDTQVLMKQKTVKDLIHNHARITISKFKPTLMY